MGSERNSDQFRQEQQRQADDLSERISNVIDQFGREQDEPMLGAVIGALAANLGQAIGSISHGRARKSAKEGADKIIRWGMREAEKTPLGNVELTSLNKRH